MSLLPLDSYCVHRSIIHSSLTYLIAPKILRLSSLPIIMGRPGDVAKSSPLPTSRKAASSEQNSSDHFKASVNADAELSFSQVRSHYSPEEQPSTPQSTSEYSKAAANGPGDQHFFWKRAQRSSETGTSSNGSAPTSPISPLTILTQRKPKKVERQSLIRSETAFTREAYPKANAFAPNLQPTISEIVEKDVPQAKQSPISETTRSSYSTSSIASGEAQKSTDIPSLRIPFAATKDGQPPREPKFGHRWKHELSGHWLEIKLGRKLRLNGTQTVSEDVSPGIRSTTSPMPPDNGQWHSGNATLPGQLSPGSGITISKATTISSREGLYCRTKRRLGLKKDPTGSTHIAPPRKSVTGEMLQEASDALREFSERKTLQGETSSIATTSVSISGNRFGLSRLLPNHRKTAHSASSSIRNLLMGKPPLPTPDPEAMYEGSDANTYLRTEIADPNGPNFLPSEARKVGTPPLSHANRGFFFNTGKTTDEGNSSPESGGVSTPGSTPGGTSRKRRGSDFDWYKVKEAADEAKDEKVEFELNLPEHLPNSPMCPRNPKHKSGGRGVCVYHGRSRISSLSGEDRSSHSNK